MLVNGYPRQERNQESKVWRSESVDGSLNRGGKAPEILGRSPNQGRSMKMSRAGICGGCLVSPFSEFVLNFEHQSDF